MDRRGFLVSLALAAMSPPAEGQQRAPIYRIGVLSEMSRKPVNEENWRYALRNHGYIEGQNIAPDFRWADGQYDGLPALVEALTDANVELILTSSTQAAIAAKKATARIPIIALIGGDPVGLGLATSVSRPGSNLTGVYIPIAETGAKRLQLLKETLPNLSSIAVLFNPAHTQARADAKNTEGTAQTLDIRAHMVELSMHDGLDRAFRIIVAKRVGAIIVIQDPVTFHAAGRIAELAIRNRLAAIHTYREFAEAGGLMSYGVSLREVLQIAGAYVDKVLKGANPADLPMEQPKGFDLVINLKTAKALGLTIPPSLLLRAHQVIE